MPLSSLGAYIILRTMAVYHVSDLFRKTKSSFSSVDLVVNNAGIVDEQNWQKCIDINLVRIQQIYYVNIFNVKRDIKYMVISTGHVIRK